MVAALGFGLAGWAQTQTVTFDFDSGGVTFRQPTPFDYTKDGLTAHFSSPPIYDPGSFSVQNTLKLSLLPGNYLSDNRIEFRNPLEIGFSQPLSAISVAFATIDSHIESPIRLTAYMDSVVVGSVRMQGVTPAGDPYPQGTLSYDSGGAPFNKVQIEIPVETPPIAYDIRYLATDFLVDNIRATVMKPPGLTSVSSASYASGAPLAAGLIASGFGQGLAAGTEAAATQPLPTTLANTTVKVRDSAGVERQAGLFFVAPAQINYLVSEGTAIGLATVTVTSAGQVTATGVVAIDRVSPGLFTANFDGKGAPAAVAITVASDLTQTVQAVARCGTAPGSCVTSPIDLGPSGAQVVLTLYGTGIRGRSSLAGVTAKIGGVDAPVQYAGAQPEFPGLDQVNVVIPRSLAGRGEVDLALTVEGKAANTVRLSIK
jgi:uncharacterized protein (TIGR03437 family)